MAAVKSNHKSPLGLPGGQVILPGQTAEVENWDKIKEHQHVKRLLEKSVLVTSVSEEPAADTGDDQKGEKGGDKTGYAVADKGRGWFVITLDGEEVTKSLRADEVSDFDAMSDEDKAAFVELHPAS